MGLGLKSVHDETAVLFVTATSRCSGTYLDTPKQGYYTIFLFFRL